MRSSCSTWPRTRATPPRPRRSSPRSAGYADGVADDTQHVLSPFAGTVIAVARATDEPIGDGETIVVIEAMKMEHEIVAGRAGIIRRMAVSVGEIVEPGQILAVIERDDEILRRDTQDALPALDERRQDLDEVVSRHQ